MIDLGAITQAERGTLTFTWEFPSTLTSPATVLAATITATMQNLDTGDVTAVTGTLTGTGATTVTWALSAEDSGTAGTFQVVFRAVVGGTSTYTLAAALTIESNPAANATPTAPLVGVPADDAAWLALAADTVPDATDLIPDAISDGRQYARQDGAWTEVVAPASTVTTVAASGAAQTLDPSVTAYIVTLTANCAFTISAPDDDYARLRLRTIQGTGGGFAISFVGTIVYDYGTAPVPLTAEANITDYVLETLDTGTTWRLAMVADGVAA